MIKREHLGYIMVGILSLAIVASFMGKILATVVCGMAFLLLLMVGPLISE